MAIYFLHLGTSEGGPFQATVNGAIAFEYWGVNGFQIRVPINPWIRKGENQIAVSGCLARLSRDEAEPYAIIGPDGEEQSFEMDDCPASDWPWLSGSRSIPEGDRRAEASLRERAIAALRPMYRAIEQNNAEVAAGFCAARTRDLAIAYEQELARRQTDTLDSFRRFMEDPEFQLAPMNWDALRLRIHPGRKLFHLENPQDGKPAARYVYPEGGGTVYMPFVQRLREDNGEIEVVR